MLKLFQPTQEQIDALVVDTAAKVKEGIKIVLQPGKYDKTNSNQLTGIGALIPVPLDGTPALLPPAGIKVINRDKQYSVEQGPLGTVMPVELEQFQK